MEPPLPKETQVEAYEELEEMTLLVTLPSNCCPPVSLHKAVAVGGAKSRFEHTLGANVLVVYPRSEKG